MTSPAKSADKPQFLGRRGRPKASEVAQREEHILQAAGEMFLRCGFDATTMDAIAEVARISKRTLYERYSDKTVLFTAVLRDLISRWLVPIDQFKYDRHELKEALLALARYLTTSALTSQTVSVHRIIISQAQHRPEFGHLANEAGRKPAIQTITSILRRHQAELRRIDLDVAAEQFMSLTVDNSLRLASLGIKVKQKDIEQWVQSSVDLFLMGVKRSSVG